MKLALLAVALTACNWSLQRMQNQPSCKPYAGTDLLPGGSCMQELPEGTVAFEAAPQAAPPLTRALLDRGRDRFGRFCATCHGVDGDGDSWVAHAMTLRKPPSLVAADVAAFPDQRILDVIANGYGVMPSYGTALPLRDRYAILYYVRVLEQRDVPLASLPPALQQEAKPWLR